MFGKRNKPEHEAPVEEADPDLTSPEGLIGPEPTGLMGAKRLNNKPVLIVGGVLAAFGLVLVYTLNERSKPHVAKDPVVDEASINAKPGSKAMPPEVLNGVPEAGVVPASYENGYGDPNAVPALSGEAPLLVQQHPVNTAGSVNQSPYASQWDSYYSQRDQQRQQRYETRVSAINSPMSVSVEGGRSAPANQPSAAMIPAGMQGGAGMAMGGMQPASGFGGAGMGRDEDLNRQGAKRDFAQGSGGRAAYLDSRVESARSPYEVKAGSVIPIVLTASVNTDLPGQITAAVTRNVYDTVSGRRLLIPQGTRLVGQYDSQVTTGQSRVLIAWNRMIYPDGSSLDLGSMVGADLSGASGARDRVNNHYRRTFGNAVFLSLFSAGVQLSQPQSAAGDNQTSGQTIAGAMGQQLGQLGMESARRNMQIQPTLELRPGLNMNVSVTQDLTLREWRNSGGRGHNR